MKKIILELFPILFITMAVLFFFNRGLNNQQIFFGADEIGSDLVSVYAQHERLASDYYKKGQIPLWTPYFGSGIPAEPQFVTYSPLVFLYVLLEAPLAFNLTIILNFLFLALGVYFYGRLIGLNKTAALFSSLVFTFSGFMIGHVRHVAITSALVGLPYLLIVLEKIIETKKFIWGLVLSFTVYLCLSFGHTTTSLMIFLMAGVYFLPRLSWQFIKEKNEDLRPVVIAGTGILLGLLLSSAILLPVYSQISGSTRASYGIENSLVPPFKLEFLRLFLQPFAYGDPSRGTWDMWKDNYWENIGYIGLLPLFLAFWGFLKGRLEDQKRRHFFGIFCFLSLLLLLGSWTPVYGLIWNWIPGFSFLRAPGRFLLYLDFGLAILAGFGFQSILEKIKDKKKYFVTGLIILVTLIDLFIFGYHFNGVLPVSYFQESETVKFLKKDTDLYRVRALGAIEAWQIAWKEAKGWTGDLSPYFTQRELLPEDNNLIYRISSPALMYGLSGRFVPRDPSELDLSILSQTNFEILPSLLGMENVKYLLSFKALDSHRDLVLVKEVAAGDKKTVYIYQNQKWLPRAYWVKQAIFIPKKETILETLLSGSFKPEKEVLIEGEVGISEEGETGEVRIASYQDNEIKIETNSTQGGYLVLADTYYPGWKAFVDGKEQKILKANYNYRALSLEAGTHQVIFSFEPKSVKYGQLISLGTLGILGFLGGFFWLKKL